MLPIAFNLSSAAATPVSLHSINYDHSMVYASKVNITNQGNVLMPPRRSGLKVTTANGDVENCILKGSGGNVQTHCGMCQSTTKDPKTVKQSDGGDDKIENKTEPTDEQAIGEDDQDENPLRAIGHYLQHFAFPIDEEAHFLTVRHLDTSLLQESPERENYVRMFANDLNHPINRHCAMNTSVNEERRLAAQPIDLDPISDDLSFGIMSMMEKFAQLNTSFPGDTRLSAHGVLFPAIKAYLTRNLSKFYLRGVYQWLNFFVSVTLLYSRTGVPGYVGNKTKSLFAQGIFDAVYGPTGLTNIQNSPQYLCK